MSTIRTFASIALGALLLVGCSGGDAPAAAGDDNAVKDAMTTMSQEEKIKFINSSPLTAEQKAAKFKEMGIDPAAAQAAPAAPGGR